MHLFVVSIYQVWLSNVKFSWQVCFGQLSYEEPRCHRQNFDDSPLCTNLCHGFMSYPHNVWSTLMAPWLHLCITIENIEKENQLNHNDETIKRTLCWKNQRCKPELKKTTCQNSKGLTKYNYQASSNYLEFHVEAFTESLTLTKKVQHSIQPWLGYKIGMTSVA